ncbi:MAG: type VII toxin-antitoxin system MntA family adenylyltransferase antitoxin [Candidatus Thorarchaeota archaeon]
MKLKREEIINALVEIMRTEEHVVAAYLFGSVATGRTTPMSDLDVAVLLDDSSPELCLALMKSLTVRISETIGLMRVDVICLNLADVAVRNSVVRHGVLFLDRDPVARAQFERLTWDEYDEMQRLWREYDHYMAQRFLERKERGQS